MEKYKEAPEYMESNEATPGASGQHEEFTERILDRALKEAGTELQRSEETSETALKRMFDDMRLTSHELNALVCQEHPGVRLAEVHNEQETLTAAFVQEIVSQPAMKSSGTRRDFLKILGGTSALALTEGFLSPVKAMEFFNRRWFGKEKKKSREEISAEYRQGVARMREHVFSSAHEIPSVFIVDRAEDDARWVEAGSGGQGYFLIPYSLLEQHLIKRPKEIRLVHTHPMETLLQYANISSERKEQIRKKEAFIPAFPPSTDDMELAMNLQEDFKIGKTDMINVSVDGRGTWEYKPDHNHPFIKEWRQMGKERMAVVEKLLSNKGFQAWQERNKSSLGHKIHYELFRIMKDSGEADQDFMDNIKRLEHVVERMAGNAHIDRIGTLTMEMMFTPSNLSAEEHEAVTARSIKEFINEYKKIGVEVQFTPYEEIFKPDQGQ